MRRFFFAAAMASYLSAGIAEAATLRTIGVDWTRGQGLWLREDGVDVQAYFTGVILIDLAEGNSVFHRDSLCVDLFTPIYLGTDHNTTLLRPDQVQLTRASWLVDNALLPSQDMSYSSALPLSRWVNTPVEGAAVQLAIWDIVHDQGDGFAAGRVQFASNGLTDAAVREAAGYYLSASLHRSSDLAFVYENTAIASGQPAQRLIGPMFLDSGPAPSPMPEPEAWVLGAVGLVLICGSRRFRRG